MRQRRVGTLSMGIILIALGGILLYAQADRKISMELLVRWWPVIPLFLGVEILWYVYGSKEEQPKVKYDIFSIFMISLILLASLGFYGLTQVGILEKINIMATAQHYTMPLPQTDINVEANIKKIVVESAPVNLQVRSGSSRTVAVSGQAYVTAQNMEQAQSLVADKMVNSRVAGDTLFISFNTPEWGNEMNYRASVNRLNIVLPADLAIEMDGADSLDIVADSIKNNWVIAESHETSIRLAATADIEVNATVNDPSQLNGNVKWVVEKPSKAEGEGPEANDEARQKITGKYISGKGTNKITIITGGNIDLNTIN